MRLPLPGDRYALIRDFVSHGADKAITRALISSRIDPLTTPEFTTVVVCAMVTEWNLVAPDGSTLPITPEGCDQADRVLIDAIEVAALKVYNGRPDPKDSGERSPS